MRVIDSSSFSDRYDLETQLDKPEALGWFAGVARRLNDALQTITTAEVDIESTIIKE